MTPGPLIQLHYSSPPTLQLYHAVQTKCKACTTAIKEQGQLTHFQDPRTSSLDYCRWGERKASTLHLLHHGRWVAGPALPFALRVVHLSSTPHNQCQVCCAVQARCCSWWEAEIALPSGQLSWLPEVVRSGELSVFRTDKKLGEPLWGYLKPKSGIQEDKLLDVSQYYRPTIIYTSEMPCRCKGC